MTSDLNCEIDIKDEYLPHNNIVLSHIEQIKVDAEEISNLTDSQRICVDQEQRRKIVEDVNSISNKVRENSRTVYQKIDMLKYEASRETKEFVRRSLTNVYNMYIARFVEATNLFKEAVTKFNNIVYERSHRELKTIYPEIADNQVKKIIERGLMESVMAKAFAGEQLSSAVSEIEHRHTIVLQLEQTIQEIYQLTLDLSSLVEVQQESLNIIDTRIQKSVEYTKNGTKDLVKADRYSKSAQRRTFYICCCIVIILLVIIFPVLASKTNLL